VAANAGGRVDRRFPWVFGSFRVSAVAAMYEGPDMHLKGASRTLVQLFGAPSIFSGTAVDCKILSTRSCRAAFFLAVIPWRIALDRRPSAGFSSQFSGLATDKGRPFEPLASTFA